MTAADRITRNAGLIKRPIGDKPLIDSLGGWVGKMLPLRGAAIATYHTNWVYFCQLFGIETAGTVEPKPGIPPSPKHVAELVEMMRTRKIGIILAANYFDEQQVRTVAARVGAVPLMVPPLLVMPVVRAVDELYLKLAPEAMDLV